MTALSFRRFGPPALLVLVVALSPGVGVNAAGTTTRVSVASDGTQANKFSRDPAISADGRFVAFSSEATNLVPGGTNGWTQAFVHDRTTGTTELVSVASDGSQGNYGIYPYGGPAISGDGRFVAFTSGSTNLVPDDTNGWIDVFVHDRETGTTERVSVASDGSQASTWSRAPAISADGRYVTFLSEATNLVPGDTNGHVDVFLRDRLGGTTERVSVASDGSQGNGQSLLPDISADGRYVAFGSRASNLVPQDTNGERDVFVHDRITDTTERVSVAAGGNQGNASSSSPSINADGRYVAFGSHASNLVSRDTSKRDVFVHDRITGTTERVSVAGNECELRRGDIWQGGLTHDISSDGRYVAFAYDRGDLVSGEYIGRRSQVYVRDRHLGTTTLVSIASDGTPDNHGYGPRPASISDDGRHIAFISNDRNLVPNDTNRVEDIFVHEIRSADPVPTWSVISLRGRDTPTRLVARGTMCPPHPGREVVVKLFKKRDGEFVRTAERVVELSEDSDYVARFPRPEPGTYKIRARLGGDSDHSASGSGITIRLVRDAIAATQTPLRAPRPPREA